MGSHKQCHMESYHTVLPVTRHKWTHPALTPARLADTRFTYPGGMEGWVDLATYVQTVRQKHFERIIHGQDKSVVDPLNHQWPKPSKTDAWDCSGMSPVRIRWRTTLTLHLPVSATLQGIGDDPVVVRDKRGYVPLRKISKNRIWDCGLLGSTHRIVFGGEKSWKQLRSSIGARDMMMMIGRTSLGDTADCAVLLVCFCSKLITYTVHVVLFSTTMSDCVLYEPHQCCIASKRASMKTHTKQTKEVIIAYDHGSTMSTGRKDLSRCRPAWARQLENDNVALPV